MIADLIALQDQRGLTGRQIAAALGCSEYVWCRVRKGETWGRGVPAKHRDAALKLLNGAQDEPKHQQGGHSAAGPGDDADPHRIEDPLPQETVAPDGAEGAGDTSHDLENDDDLDALLAMNDAAAGDGGGQPEIDHDAILADFAVHLEQFTTAPTPGELTAICRALAEARANEAAVQAAADMIIAKWHDTARKKDQDRIRSTMVKTWKAEEKGLLQRLALQRAAQAAVAAKDPNGEPTPEERAAVRAQLWPGVQELAMQPNILALALEQVAALGVVGEQDLVRIVYLAATSRVTYRPVNPLVYGASAGGKSFTSEQVLRLLPPEEQMALTTASAKSFVYDEQPIKFKVVFIREATQIQNDDNSEFALSLRTLISEGRIDHRVVETRDDGSRFTQTYTKEGPVCVLVTTTAADIHAENETRMMRIGIHETAEQTAAVMKRIGARYAAGQMPDDPPQLALWQDFQRWIAAGPRDVVIPFAETLAEKIPPVVVRFRRDMSALLGLISAHALLHQALRDRAANGAVIATLEDYSAVRGLVGRVFSESAGKQPTETVCRVVHLVEEKLAENPAPATEKARFSRRAANVVKNGKFETSARRVGELLGVDKMAADRAVRRAIDDGYLINHETLRGKPMLLTLGQRRLGAADTSLLPPPEALL